MQQHFFWSLRDILSWLLDARKGNKCLVGLEDVVSDILPNNFKIISVNTWNKRDLLYSWRFSRCSAPIHCHMNLYLRRRKEKTSEASVKHAGLEGEQFANEASKKIFSRFPVPLLSQVFCFALASSSLTIPPTRLNRGLWTVWNITMKLFTANCYYTWATLWLQTGNSSLCSDIASYKT